MIVKCDNGQSSHVTVYAATVWQCDCTQRQCDCECVRRGRVTVHRERVSVTLTVDTVTVRQCDCECAHRHVSFFVYFRLVLLTFLSRCFRASAAT